MNLIHVTDRAQRIRNHIANILDDVKTSAVGIPRYMPGFMVVKLDSGEIAITTPPPYSHPPDMSAVTRLFTGSLALAALFLTENYRQD